MLRTIYNNDTWGLVQQEKEKGQAIAFHFKVEKCEFTYLFIKRLAGVVDGQEYYDIVTPRGESGFAEISGFIDKETVSEFDRIFGKYCAENNIVAEYIRFDPWNLNTDDFSHIYNITPHGFEYCVRVSDEDFFMHQYSAKRRNIIRKALNCELRVESNVESNEGISCLLDLYNFTDEKYSISEYYKLTEEFLYKYVELLDDKVSFCIIKADDIPISVGMFLNGGDVYHYHFSANHPDYSTLNASSLMLYKEMMKAKEEGCMYFDLGSATIGSGLEMFKKSWCLEENILKCFCGTKVRLPEIYQKLIEINGKEDGYFPEYKRIIN